MWIPETSFNIGKDGMRGEIEGVQNIPKARYRLTCEICKKKVCIEPLSFGLSL
jgi:hypothetical protein